MTGAQLATVEAPIRGFWSRINTHVVKLAMLFHVSDCPEDLNIRTEDWSRAVLLMDGISATVRHLTADVALDRTGKALNSLGRIISENGGIDKRKLLQRSHLKAPDFHVYMATLMQTEEVHYHPDKNPQGPATTWVCWAANCSQEGR